MARARDTASRELKEEVGVAVDSSNLRLALEVTRADPESPPTKSPHTSPKSSASISPLASSNP